MIGAGRRPVAAYAGAALWFGLGLPPVRALLESTMLTHMAVQIPLLAVVGLCLARPMRRREPAFLAEADWLGIPSILVAAFAMTFWMLPRSLDAAIGHPMMELAKFVSVPALLGLPLALGWRRLPAVGRGFVWANGLSMLAGVGGIYLAAPTRLCAYYRLDQQVVAGWGLIALAVALGAYWVVIAFAGWPGATPDRVQNQRSGGPSCHRA